MDNVTWKMIKSDIGDLYIQASNKGIRIIRFINENEEAPNIESVNNPKHLKYITQLKKELKEYFSSKRTKFDVAIDMQGTPFQIKVWNALLTIPYGTTRSYKEQSIFVGDVKAIRAVGAANGKNPIPIVIPCHRVIGSDGSLTGFAGGIWRKKLLLELEGNQLSLF